MANPVTSGFTPPALPPTFLPTHPPPELIYQGAEALIYKTVYIDAPNSSIDATDPKVHFPVPTRPAALKHRPAKPYRHPLLDAKLTRHRILSEARVLVKLRREGVNVPAVYALDWEEGWMLFEWIAGATVRKIVDEIMRPIVENRATPSADVEEGLMSLMQRIGRAVGKVHEVGVIHGDLTTSNLMLQHTQPLNEYSISSMVEPTSILDGEIVLIDFGLSAQSASEEDRAVDLYVLERAFGSSHPRTETLWQEVLRTYGGTYKGAKTTLKRLDEVRMRGRKKIMIG